MMTGTNIVETIKAMDPDVLHQMLVDNVRMNAAMTVEDARESFESIGQFIQAQIVTFDEDELETFTSTIDASQQAAIEAASQLWAEWYDTFKDIIENELTAEEQCKLREVSHGMIELMDEFADKAKAADDGKLNYLPADFYEETSRFWKLVAEIAA